MSLNYLKERIETMQKYHQIEILRILKKYSSVKMNENNNGTFINLTELPENVIGELEKYTKYVDVQQIQLKNVESEKNKIEQHFFTT
jgi:hypothetical protein